MIGSSGMRMAAFLVGFLAVVGFASAVTQVNTSPNSVNVTTDPNAVQVNGQTVSGTAASAAQPAAAPPCANATTAPATWDPATFCPALDAINQDTTTYPPEVGDNAAWLSCNLCPADQRGNIKCDGATGAATTPATPASGEAAQVNVAPAGQAGSQVNVAPPGAGNVSQANVIGRRRLMAVDMFATCANANALWATGEGETAQRASRLFCQLGCNTLCQADLTAIETAGGKIVACGSPPAAATGGGVSSTLQAAGSTQTASVGPNGVNATLTAANGTTLNTNLPRRSSRKLKQVNQANQASVGGGGTIQQANQASGGGGGVNQANQASVSGCDKSPVVTKCRAWCGNPYWCPSVCCGVLELGNCGGGNVTIVPFCNDCFSSFAPILVPQQCCGLPGAPGGSCGSCWGGGGTVQQVNQASG